ncbi:MAG: TGS domain-containing protein, partial [Clostridiales bacterium]
MSLSVKLPDGSQKNYPEAVSASEIAGELSRSLAKKAVAAKVNGRTVDLSLPLEGDIDLELLTFEDEDGKTVFRHSSSHILAQAVQKLFPGTLLGIGPAIKDGFYYDFDSSHIFTQDDFAAIEKEMSAIVKANLPFVREELSREKALALFDAKGEKYKLELINDLPEDAAISIYQQGDYIDLCAGPHLPATGMVKAIKIMSVAGAYWRGNEKNKMLQRIYATSFADKKELADYLFRMEEAKKRDHRKLGAELGLFVFMDEGPGFPFFLPKGMILRNQLEKFWREEHEKWNYLEIKTPMMLNRK